MLKSLITFLFGLVCMTYSGFAQEKISSNKITLHSINSVRLLNGSTGSAFSLQTIFGASVHNSFAGIGLGIDYYKFRSIPLFLDLRHEFSKRKRSLFIYGDLGYNFDWLTDKNKNENPFFRNPNYQGGIYYETGIGYKIGFMKTDALLISTGYSFKKLKNEVGTGICPFVGPCSDEIETYTYSFPRWVISLGWRF